MDSDPSSDVCPPVLFLIFNRPDLTAQVFRQIRKARPRDLFIASDGPRNGIAEDRELVMQTRSVVADIDWPCSVKCLYQDSNLGLKQAVKTAIDWFFEQVDEGIILEDDCLPDPTFFTYCGKLLERYRHDERIFAISGDGYLGNRYNVEHSYIYTCYFLIWGWATWKRAWQHYDAELQEWPILKQTRWLRNWLGGEDKSRYWTQVFERVHRNEITTWDYQWNYSAWLQSGLCILPTTNLVSNIGFDNRATHTTWENDIVADVSRSPMQFPLCHPDIVIRDYEAEHALAVEKFRVPISGTRFRKFANCLDRLCDACEGGLRILLRRIRRRLSSGL